MDHATILDRWFDEQSITAISNKSAIRTATVADSTAEISSPKKQGWVDFVQQQFKAISGLQPGWDGFGAGPVRRDVISFAVQILTQVMGSETPPPYISPMSHEGLLMEWHLPDIELEIEVETPGEAWISYTNTLEGISDNWEVKTILFTLAEPIAKLERSVASNP